MKPKNFELDVATRLSKSRRSMPRADICVGGAPPRAEALTTVRVRSRPRGSLGDTSSHSRRVDHGSSDVRMPGADVRTPGVREVHRRRGSRAPDRGQGRSRGAHRRTRAPPPSKRELRGRARGEKHAGSAQVHRRARPLPRRPRRHPRRGQRHQGVPIRALVRGETSRHEVLRGALRHAPGRGEATKRIAPSTR